MTERLDPLIVVSRKIRRDLDAAEIAVGKNPTKENLQNVLRLRSLWISVFSITEMYHGK